MNAPLAVFRCDAGPVHGTGHVRRCLSLARVFRDAGWHTGFATDEASLDAVPELLGAGHQLAFVDGAAEPRVQASEVAAAWPRGADLLVTDHYGLEAVFERACRGFSRRRVALDDLADRERDADLLFDSASQRSADAYKTLLPRGALVLTGTGYALLGSAFAQKRASSLERRDGRIESILISLGGIDPGPVLERLVDGLALGGFIGELTVVLGMEMPVAERLRARTEDPFNLEVAIGVRDMADRLVTTDLAIGAGGSSAWERCALGVPMLLVVTARNQDLIADGLAREGAAQLLGWHEEVDAALVAELFTDLDGDRDQVLALSGNAAVLCDGRGAERTWLASLNEAAPAGQIGLRLADASDGGTLFDWQNAPQTRRYARNAHTPSRAEHDAWFAARLTDPDCLLCVITCDGKDAGSLRLDRQEAGSDRVVSIYLAPETYGGGVATAALTLAQRLAPGWRLVAEVLAENEASHRLFQRAGFRSDGEGTYIWEAAA